MFGLLFSILFPGMTLREMNDIRRMGRKMYFKIGCSMSDILQLVLYWVYIAFSFLAMFQVIISIIVVVIHTTH